ncbi:MAG: NAD-dependent DNA ligase LigA [Lachnospiraceae bacterium]|nr:NAD-dependent DNA ligase LigA [Lachnospiraceae bacterium]
MDKTSRLKELIDILNEASKAYYQSDKEIMTNYEYDALYDELKELEEETGMVFSNSPTVNVGYEVLSELPKETHKRPMLSLDKTKEIAELEAFLKDKEGVLSWKLDGLTVVLTYDNGELKKAVTRGNGEIGEVITNNAKVFKNIPLQISFKGELVIRGEALISYSDFEIINREIVEEDKYKNPRNLCAGSVRQLNNQITKERNVLFYAFTLVSASDMEFDNSLMKQLEFLENQGFDVVGHTLVNAENVAKAVDDFAKKIENFDLPSDGLVLIFNDIAYGESLGSTAKFPRNGIAFKWKDETAVTKLIEIEWSPSRTGLINPIAIFEPVSLEGTTVSRASVHNVSILKSLKLGIGDEIEVYKANMIIPQIARNITMSGNLKLPQICPACNQGTEIRTSNDVEVLYCINPKCPAKEVKKYAHFVSRDAMNIDGLSEETLEKFLDKGLIKEYADLYHLDRYEDIIVNMPGFGRKSYDNIIKAIDNSREVIMPKLIHSLGIANIGLSNAKVLCRNFDYDMEKLISARIEDLTVIDGIGEVIAKSFRNYFEDSDNKHAFDNLLSEVKILRENINTAENAITGKNFVITGSVYNYANRNELKDEIESMGGKVTGSVTAKTDYLINNDITSASSKNKKAKELGVSIITEEDYIKMKNDK